MTFPDLSDFLLGATPEFHRRPLSRSSLRPSLTSVNVLFLHPATLRPVSGRRMSHASSTRKSATGSHVAAPDDADQLSALPSSLPATGPQDISQLPSLRDTATRPSTSSCSGLPISSSSPSSTDFFGFIEL